MTEPNEVCEGVSFYTPDLTDIITFTLRVDRNRMSRQTIEKVVENFKATDESYLYYTSKGFTVLVVLSDVQIEIMSKMTPGEIVVVTLDSGSLKLPPSRWKDYVDATRVSLAPVFPDNKIVFKSNLTDISIISGDDPHYDGDSYQ